MSKYVRIYETLCPDDLLSKDDPRRPVIIEELKAVVRAKTDADAVSVIAWWNVWPNPQHQTPLEFVQKVKQLA